MLPTGTHGAGVCGVEKSGSVHSGDLPGLRKGNTAQRRRHGCAEGHQQQPFLLGRQGRQGQAEGEQQGQ